ncbi:MAG: hypothetical protein AAFZ52_07145 [Bacteroidota bacterium]
MQEESNLINFVFHLYNRSNDQCTIFREDENYQFFLAKMKRQLLPVARLLAYCIMPNHFHVLLVPNHPVREDFPLDGERHNVMPTREISEGVRRWLMGYTKAYNKRFELTGSRFQQHSKAKHHRGGIREGLDYIHLNPVRAKLVADAADWQFSSYNEHEGMIHPKNCLCDLDLVRLLLAQ